MSDAFSLSPPEEFSFPFTPYHIQKDFMRNLFQAVEEHKVGIFESPTGTGKSLSIICSTLTWLHSDRKRLTEEAVDTLTTKLKAECPDEPDWVLKQDIERKKRELLAGEEELEEPTSSKRNRNNKLSDQQTNKRRKIAPVSDQSDEEFAPEEDEDQKDKIGPNGLPRSVYFTSRTHSQLSQFVSELRKTSFGLGTRLIALGSRSNLCVNEEVKKKAKSLEALNEACTDLQKGDKSSRCCYLPPMEDDVIMNDFRDYALSEVRDIEELANLGKERGVCPYYGARKALRQAQVVTLPYNLLLQKSSRNALGISLTDNVIIVDEAHNLIDNVLSIHSSSISSNFLELVKNSFKIYIQKFSKKLKGTNLVHLQQLVRVFECLGNYCDEFAKRIPKNVGKYEEIVTTNSLLQKTGSKIINKISGYATKVETVNKNINSNDQAFKTRSNFVTGFYKIQSFMLALSNAEKDGRVLSSSERSSTDDQKVIVTLKYQLLNPSETFRDVASEARSVILAGGTMAPISDFRTQLFPYLGPDRFLEFACAHIVPQENLLVRVVPHGPSKIPLELKFSSKGDNKLLDDLGQSISNICNVVKDGIVCFFPSYAILDSLRDRWTSTGLLSRLENRKKVFNEPKSSADVESTLKDYASAINSPTAPQMGALLFAVVGGKLSEGINFSNELCRAVIVIGIPYPNANSIELKERIKYAESLSGGKREAGAALYSNMAFKAVVSRVLHIKNWSAGLDTHISLIELQNQSIGRSIRHANDWSSIILLDSRYGTENSQKKLPGWINSSLQISDHFGKLIKDLAQFNQKMIKKNVT
ncbi:hypothetical protein DFH28DRAFT_1091401 [Melampsora americana]|nr:hypothetical protein DFH28DRAFT_1091401 [Melampsora americana]